MKAGRSQLYLFPWRYRGWCHQIPFLHCGPFHFCFLRMGRGRRFWLPNFSITYVRVSR